MSKSTVNHQDLKKKRAKSNQTSTLNIFLESRMFKEGFNTATKFPAL